MPIEKPIINWETGVFWCGSIEDHKECITAEVTYKAYSGKMITRRIYVSKWLYQGYRSKDDGLENLIDDTYQFILDSKPEDYIIRYDTTYVNDASRYTISTIREASSPQTISTSIIDILPDKNYLWVAKIKAVDQLKLEKEDPEKWRLIHALINADDVDDVDAKFKECLRNDC